MHIGHYISGAGHLGLIGWMIVGGWLSPRPDPVEITEVSVISGAAFDALLAGQQPPQNVTEVAQPAMPETQEETPEVAVTEDAVIEQPPPLQTETPVEEVVPDTPEPPAETVVEDVPPDLAEPVGDVAVLVPEVAPEAAPRPVERVAPEPVAQPNPEATPDPIQQDAATAESEAETQAPEEQDATAPEEATTEIVTEATQAPAASVRPPGRRPAAPLRQAAQTPTEEPDEETDDAAAAAIAAAVAEAQATPTPAVPSGPPLTSGEKENLRVAVSQCWNVGSLSTEALNTTVVVSVAMNQDGTPIVGSIKMEGSEGGSATAARQAFEAARRAIIRCGARGYQLPAEKYGQWQTIEMTFNPERMRVK